MGYHNHYNDADFQRSGNRLTDGDKFHIGIDETVREIRKKGEHVLVAAKQALEEGAKIVVKDMERRVPVYKLSKGRKSVPRHIVPGLLKRSIQYDVLKDGALIVFSANARNPKDNFLYGQILEFSGWRMLRGKKVSTEKREFMYPAIDAKFATVNKMVKNAIDQAFARG